MKKTVLGLVCATMVMLLCMLCACDPSSYEVKFMDADGATEISVVTVASGETLTVPADPAINPSPSTVYTFAGWATEMGGEPVDMTTITISGNMVFYAVFTETAREYTVKFVNDVAQIGETATVNYNATVTAPADPTKAETDGAVYTFAGWATEMGGEVVDLATYKVTSDVVFYAVFTETVKQYSVKFMLGTEELSSAMVDYNTNPVAPQDPTKEATASTAYTFAGWATEEDGKPSGVDTYLIWEDTVFYAIFEESVRTYNIVFMNGEKAIETLTLEYGATPDMPVINDEQDETTYYQYAGVKATEDGELLSALPQVSGDATYYVVFNTLVKSKESKDVLITETNVSIADAETQILEFTLNGEAKTLSANALDLAGLVAGEYSYIVKTADKYIEGTLTIVTKYIATQDDLYTVFGNNAELDGYYVVTANITGKGQWTRLTGVNSFKGTIDGRGYTIRDIATPPSVNYWFKSFEGKIKNIAFTDVWLYSNFFGNNSAVVVAELENVYFSIKWLRTDEGHPNCGVLFQNGDANAEKPNYTKYTLNNVVVSFDSACDWASGFMKKGYSSVFGMQWCGTFNNVAAFGVAEAAMGRICTGYDGGSGDVKVYVADSSNGVAFPAMGWDSTYWTVDAEAKTIAWNTKA